jgi:DNA-binding transcriptional regulator PaaX
VQDSSSYAFAAVHTTVHVHRGATIKRGTLAAILDDAGLSVDELRAIL